MTQRLTSILQHIRWKNIVIFLLFQSIIYLRFTTTNTDVLTYVLFNLVLVFFAAAGNIQNDVYDILVDGFSAKKKHIIAFENKKKWMQLVWILNVAGILLAFYLYGVNNRLLFFQLAIIPLFLSLYNLQLKRVALVGNVVVSGTIAYVLYQTLYTFFVPQKVYNFLILMAFLLHLFRELVKDIEDKDADKKAGYYTLPILSSFFTNLTIRAIAVGYLVSYKLYASYFSGITQHILVFLTVVAVFYSIFLVNNYKISRASAVLKITMLVGMLSILGY